ncbi:MAG: BON domain-containing protein [Humidesulfovibrio sp.]|nr:BON domain-containing protein [Humidesulfovibrio sp.]
MRVIRLLTILSLLAFLAGGCASVPLMAALDMMNVAETSKTGYDMATGLSSRKSLEQDVSPDAQAEARLRSALDSQGGLLRYAVAQVSQGRGYVVGTYASPEELERARRATRNVQGVTGVTLCLFPAGSRPRLRATDGEIRDNIVRLAGIRTRDVRVHVVEGNAVLIGHVRTKVEQDQLLESARIAGAASVRDYIHLMAAR